MRKQIRKWAAILLALAMTLGCAAASAQTVYGKLNIDVDNLTAMLPGFGVPEEQLGMLGPILGIVNALGVKLTTAADGAQVDLDLNGTEAVSIGFSTNEEGAAVVSNLFPNCVLTIKTETASGILQNMMANSPFGAMMGGFGGTGTDGGEAGEGQMSILPMTLESYINNFVSACSAAAQPGEAVPGEYQFDGYNFDTMVPVTVDMQTIRQAFDDMAEGVMGDESVMGEIRSYAQTMGVELSPETLRSSLREFEAHFPDTVTAEYYANSADSTSFYLEGRALYEGKEEPTIGYSMLKKDSTSGTISFRDTEQEMVAGVIFTNTGFRVEFSMGEVNTVLNFAYEPGDPGEIRCDLYLNTASPLVSLRVTIAESGERTLPTEAGERTVVALEDLMSGSEAASALTADLMANGLPKLMAALQGAVPGIESLLGMFMGGGVTTITPGDLNGLTGEGRKTVPAGKKVLRLGTSVYTIVVDEGYAEQELTADEIAEGIVAYVENPGDPLDFDVFQFSKEGYPEDLKECMTQESEKHDASGYGMMGVNGIDMGWYRAEATYEGEVYETSNYLLDNGVEYVQVRFWLDGDNAESRAEDIMETIGFILRDGE